MDKPKSIDKTKVTNNVKQFYIKKNRAINDQTLAAKPLNSQQKLPREEIEAKVKNFFDTYKDFKMLVSVAKLMEAGAHIGLSRQMWNPKMSLFIYKSKKLTKTIIDILKIIVFLSRAYNFLYDISENEGKILFVGTHNDHIKNYVKEEATRVGAFYVNQRWLGGTLTNYRTINNAINKLNRLINLKNNVLIFLDKLQN